jgi:ATP-dependent helicase HrpA
LFTEDDFQSRPQYTPPEIMRANLAEVILRMISLKLGDIAEFPFVDHPDLKNIKDGFNLLFELGAIARSSKGKAQRAGRKGPGAGGREPGAAGAGQRAAGNGDVAAAAVATSGGVELTEKGRIMARIPLDPRLSRMLIEAQKQGCIPEVAVIAAVLSIADPRERPAEKAGEADRMQAVFVDQSSDFVTLLNIWHRYHAHWQSVKSNNQMKRFCREHFISFKRMREWRDVHSQIAAILREHNLGKSAFDKLRRDKVGMRKWEGGKGEWAVGRWNFN